MPKKPSSGKRGNLSQFGLIDIPDFDDADEPMNVSDDDLDLEAELAAISGRQKRPRPQKPAPAAPADLDAMIAASLKDIPSDEDVSGDEDDPDLLNELQELSFDEGPQSEKRATRPAPPPPGCESSMVSLLQERLSNYTLAEKTAKENGETSRARRFNRGIKTLNDLLKQAKAGGPIKDEDIPPPVSVGKPAQSSEAATNSQSSEPQVPAPVPPPRSTSVTKLQDPETRSPTPPEPKEPPPPPPVLDDVDPAKAEGVKLILKRKEEFKAAALASKRDGEKSLALEYLKVVKQFDLVIDAYKAGQEMDLNELPTPEAIASAFKEQNKEDSQVQHSSGE